MNVFCNPLNLEYKFQFYQKQEGYNVLREAADPSVILFHGAYYMFVSMNLVVWKSEDMVHWASHPLPSNLPLNDYAPDVCVIGDYVVFSASHRGEKCDYYRTKDIINGPYEKIDGTFDFWDPNLFRDDDGRIYFYWGCSNVEPIYGVELDPVTFRPLDEKRIMIAGDISKKGFERFGEDHSARIFTPEEVDKKANEFLSSMGVTLDKIPEAHQKRLRISMNSFPYIEGAWMNKIKGKYYLQYANPGTQFNTYSDAVYVSDSPLGPFVLAENNPFSYKPGGFITGAGHGSTLKDLQGRFWHAASMRISVNHSFERRIGLFPSGVDSDGELFCDQRFGDWPIHIEDAFDNPFSDPRWMLLSYQAKTDASSSESGFPSSNVANENIRNWWKAGSNRPGEWVSLDLGEISLIHAIQINFADDKPKEDLPTGVSVDKSDFHRYIDEREHHTRWILESSVDGNHYSVVADKSEVLTNLPHDLLVIDQGVQAKYLRLTVIEVPFHEPACISGLRVFGVLNGKKPDVPIYKVRRTTPLDMEIDMEAKDAEGYTVLWGHAPERLYHSFLTYQPHLSVGALVYDRDYFVRVDAFNKHGITRGKVSRL